jgi:hypothetical protein
VDRTVPLGLEWIWAHRLGGENIYFNRYCLTSYGMANVKSSYCTSHDERVADWRHKTESECRALLVEHEPWRKFMAPEGAWWWRVKRWIAERDGDAETIAAAKEYRRKARADLGLDPDE